MKYLNIRSIAPTPRKAIRVRIQAGHVRKTGETWIESPPVEEGSFSSYEAQVLELPCIEPVPLRKDDTVKDGYEPGQTNGK